jgi:DNA invertase Pin-like site-specific DNA recombinase
MWLDEDVSAFSTPLFGRPAGKKMWDALGPGDTVVMTKIDRAFRSWVDAANAITALRPMGVTLRFLDLDMDLSTPQGELFFSQMVAFAQFESRMHGQRKREVYAHKRRMGQPYSRTRPYGWKVTKDKAGKMIGWEPLAYERKLGQEVLAMRDAGKSWNEIANAVCLRGVRKFSPYASGESYYHVKDIRCLARAAEAQYPTVPQAFWLANDYEQKLRAAIADGWKLSS